VLGVGWNFAFVGASALVLETHLPQERNKVQASTIPGVRHDGDRIVSSGHQCCRHVIAVLRANGCWRLANAIRRKSARARLTADQP